jgi:hypothetical protein
MNDFERAVLNTLLYDMHIRDFIRLVPEIYWWPAHVREWAVLHLEAALNQEEPCDST